MSLKITYKYLHKCFSNLIIYTISKKINSEFNNNKIKISVYNHFSISPCLYDIFLKMNIYILQTIIIL